MQSFDPTPLPLYQVVLIGLLASIAVWLLSGSYLFAILSFVFVAGGRLGIAYWNSVSEKPPQD
ncbi:hypothetical protein CA223_12430 [Sphingomonas koreensis]|jgi:hypothetical protein|uniref:Uncharacterized protein n=2 Tax=cellular organisms TaxID=131567 RepID=A0A1L6JA72_9SPHN|nr:hypothetical protein [Sphingomonas koreensis]APR52400.1 hypothetical protein BRX40_08115 [Sphingomonas koreensis]MDC7811558.1 hypothetical protein [Sphingomonas koreensis]RSU19710.1 hypothetical protein CA224_11680 [Sphingomonas koreensis]RSU26498.1 hypothetical protein CA222_09395 [Sphingomonas koreensis]RSU27280.1 hypothetical protein CA225_11080 [Sphingomonas koreensis]